MSVKTINICLNKKIIKDFDASIQPVHRSTAIAILIHNFLQNEKTISEYGEGK